VAAVAASAWERDISSRQEGRFTVTEGEFPKAGEVGEEFLRLARFPKNIGSLVNPSATGSAVGQCGDSIEVSLRIERESIAEIKVQPHGCVYTLVCASAMSELAKGRHLDQALNLEPIPWERPLLIITARFHLVKRTYLNVSERERLLPDLPFRV
jgi:hypothetical protein